MSGIPTRNITDAINRINSLKSQIEIAKTSSINLDTLKILIGNVKGISNTLFTKLNELFKNLNELDISGIGEQVEELKGLEDNLRGSLTNLSSLIPLTNEEFDPNTPYVGDLLKTSVPEPKEKQEGGYNWRSKSKSRSKSRSKSSSKKSTRKNKKSKSKKI